jgi:ubiquinone/menaquinone biosynthesis C-methylase UbiE
MEARLQLRIQRYGWDKAAHDYEESWSRQLEPAQRRLLAMAALRPGERALDIACGTGLISFPAAAAVGPGGTVIGTDISAGMVERAREEAMTRLVPNVTFRRMEAEKLEFPDAAFDAALCALGLMYVPDPLAALREAYRVLKPGGRYAAAVWGRRERCGWAGIFPVVDARVASEVCPLFFQLGIGDNLRTLMDRAGFEDIETTRLETRLEYESAEQAVRAAFAGGPVALAYSRFDERTRREAHDDYLLTIEPYRAGGGYSVPGEFVVAAGRKAGTPFRQGAD